MLRDVWDFVHRSFSRDGIEWKNATVQCADMELAEYASGLLEISSASDVFAALNARAGGGAEATAMSVINLFGSKAAEDEAGQLCSRLHVDHCLDIVKSAIQGLSEGVDDATGTSKSASSLPSSSSAIAALHELESRFSVYSQILQSSADDDEISGRWQDLNSACAMHKGKEALCNILMSTNRYAIAERAAAHWARYCSRQKTARLNDLHVAVVKASVINFVGRVADRRDSPKEQARARQVFVEACEMLARVRRVDAIEICASVLALRGGRAEDGEGEDFDNYDTSPYVQLADLACDMCEQEIATTNQAQGSLSAAMQSMSAQLYSFRALSKSLKVLTFAKDIMHIVSTDLSLQVHKNLRKSLNKIAWSPIGSSCSLTGTARKRESEPHVLLVERLLLARQYTISKRILTRYRKVFVGKSFLHRVVGQILRQRQSIPSKKRREKEEDRMGKAIAGVRENDRTSDGGTGYCLSVLDLFNDPLQSARTAIHLCDSIGDRAITDPHRGGATLKDLLRYARSRFEEAELSAGHGALVELSAGVTISRKPLGESAIARAWFSPASSLRSAPTEGIEMCERYSKVVDIFEQLSALEQQLEAETQERTLDEERDNHYRLVLAPLLARLTLKRLRDPDFIRKLRDALAKAELFELALEVCGPCQVETHPVNTELGMRLLSIYVADTSAGGGKGEGLLLKARKRFELAFKEMSESTVHACVKKIVHLFQPFQDLATRNELELQAWLECKTLPAAVDTGKYDCDRHRECLHYIETYGSTEIQGAPSILWAHLCIAFLP